MKAAAEVEARASAAREASALDACSKQSVAMEVDDSFTPYPYPAPPSGGHLLRSAGVHLTPRMCGTRYTQGADSLSSSCPSPASAAVDHVVLAAI